jgi:hypothetical protein
MRTAPAPVLGSFTPRFPVTRSWCAGGPAARQDRTRVRRVRRRDLPLVPSAQKRDAQWLVEYGLAVMTTAVKAIYENGVFNPKEPVNLQERTEVEVLVPTQATSDDDPTGWAVQALIGFIDDAPADMAEHHDHYLHGRPRE